MEDPVAVGHTREEALGAAMSPQQITPATVKKFEILGRAHVGDTLRITVFKAAKYGDFGIIDGAVYKGEELIARGELKVWQSDGKTAA